MSAAESHDRIGQALRPAQLRLDLAKRSFLRRVTWTRSLGLLPQMAILLCLGYWLICYLEAPPFAAWLVPLLLLLTPLLPFLMLPGRLPRTGTAEAAFYCDRSLHNHDRLSAAYEFSRPDHSPGRFEQAAIEDGLAGLEQVSGARPDLDLEQPRAPRWAPWLGLLIACLPALLPLPQRRGVTATEPTPQVLEREEAEPGTEPRPPGREAPAAERPDPGVLQPEEVAMEPGPDKAGTEGESQNLGQLQQGSQRRSKGLPQASRSGKPNPSQASGGGQGQPSQSGQKEENQEAPRKRPPRKQSQLNKPRTPKPRAAKPDPSSSSATPGGPSKSGGQMAAVGNQRQSRARAVPNDDDSDEEEEELEDEKEEQDARGGVMPLGRDRQQSPARELSISGDGPPQDGRGGPTPPKKSRGTASLVLGIRLPDRVRGQPNPGTAKTSIEQVPPGPNPGRPGPPSQTVAAAPTNPQTPDPHRPGLAPLIKRYHELLRQAEQIRQATQPRTR